MSLSFDEKESRVDMTLHVRRGDHDIAGFAERIAELVTTHEPVVVHLSHIGKGSDQIALGVYENSEES